MPLTAAQIINQLKLEPLPKEGGFYRRNYETTLQLDFNKGYEQPVGTGIYFLLTKDTFSAFHWLIEDELYHFYLGDPVELFELCPEEGLKKTVLGPDIVAGQTVQYAVKKNRWQGSRVIEEGAWALLGTTMAPGFVWEDFELGSRDELTRQFPDHTQLIESLTRIEDGRK